MTLHHDTPELLKPLDILAQCTELMPTDKAYIESYFADIDTALEMYEYLADKRMSCHEHAAKEYLLTWEAEKKKGGNHG